MLRTAVLRPMAAAAQKSAASAPTRRPMNGSVSIRLFAGGKSSSPSTSPMAAVPSLLSKNYACTYYGPLHLARCNNPQTRRVALRCTSSSTSNQSKDGGNKNQSTSEGGAGKEGAGAEEPMSQEIVLTPGEKVVVGTRLFFWAGAFAFASVCAYYIGKELLPTKMSPNTVFDKATNVIRDHDEVKRRFGEPVKTYGRDHGGHREGRRNFIEHTEYTDADDGSKRTRVRFNLEGPYGAAFVFAEVSKDMPSGEFVYILVQDKRNGAVITVQDNRSALLAKKLAGGSAEGQNVFSNLLGGGGSK